MGSSFLLFLKLYLIKHLYLYHKYIFQFILPSFFFSLKVILLNLLWFAFFSYFSSHLFCMGFIFTLFILVSCLWVNSIVEIRLYKHTEQSLYNLLNFFVWLPFSFSDHFFTDIAIFNVRMPNMSFKFDYRKLEWKLLGEIEID